MHHMSTMSAALANLLSKPGTDRHQPSQKTPENALA
jgi:hypothetical protein